MQNVLTENCEGTLAFLSLPTVSHFKVGEALQTSKLQGEANLIKVNYRNELGNCITIPIRTI
jgi:hypothetical protein